LKSPCITTSTFTPMFTWRLLSQTGRVFVFFEIVPNRTFLKNRDPYKGASIAHAQKDRLPLASGHFPLLQPFDAFRETRKRVRNLVWQRPWYARGDVRIRSPLTCIRCNFTNNHCIRNCHCHVHGNSMCNAIGPCRHSMLSKLTLNMVNLAALKDDCVSTTPQKSGAGL
jgi:hypothetical protein